MELFPSSGEGREISTLFGSVIKCLRLALSKGNNRVEFSPHLQTETDPVSETRFVLL
jgi:hypothetical protein